MTPEDYEGAFYSVNGTIANIKGGYAQSYNNDTGEIKSRAFIAGYSVNPTPSISAGYTSYTMVNGRTIEEILNKHGEDHFDNLKQMYEEITSGNKGRNYNQIGEVNND